MVRASAGDLARAGMVRGQLPVAPSRESTQFSSRAASAQGLPRTGNTSFASHMPASQTNRVPFEQQRTTMTSAGRSSGTGSNSAGFNNGARSGAASSGASNGGWRSFDPSNRGANGTAGGAGTNGARTGRAAQRRNEYRRDKQRRMAQLRSRKSRRNRPAAKLHAPAAIAAEKLFAAACANQPAHRSEPRQLERIERRIRQWLKRCLKWRLAAARQQRRSLP